MGINEENIIENFVCFISGGARAGPLLRLRQKSTGSATLYKCILSSEKGGSWLQICLEYVKTYLVKTFLSEQELAKKSGVVIKKSKTGSTGIHRYFTCFHQWGEVGGVKYVYDKATQQIFFFVFEVGTGK